MPLMRTFVVEWEEKEKEAEKAQEQFKVGERFGAEAISRR